MSDPVLWAQGPKRRGARQPVRSGRRSSGRYWPNETKDLVCRALGHLPRRLWDIRRSSTALRAHDDGSSFDNRSSFDDRSFLDDDCPSLDYDGSDDYSSHYCATGSVST